MNHLGYLMVVVLVVIVNIHYVPVSIVGSVQKDTMNLGSSRAETESFVSMKTCSSSG